MSFSIIEVIIIFTIVQLLFFVILLWSRKSNNKVSNRILSLFFLSLVLNILNLYLGLNTENLSRTIIHLTLIGGPFAFLYAPLFYFYIKSITSGFDQKKMHIIFHMSLFIFYGFYLSWSYYFKDAETKLYLLQNKIVLPPKLVTILTAILQLQVLSYLILCMKSVVSFKSTIKQYYSSFSKIQYRWAVEFISILTLLYIIDVIRFFTKVVNSDLQLLIELILFSGLILFCYWVIYKAITQPIIIVQHVNKSQQKVGINSKIRKEYRDKLLKYMKLNKPYLNPDLTLSELAKSTSIPQRTLSEIVNSELDKTFYDFINSYRINEAIIQLSESNEKRTVLEILYDVGFNSKSSFNTSFKKITGLTPSQFREQKNQVKIPPC